MTLNLYDLHPDPQNAPGYATRYDDVPEFVWERYHDKPKELKKREKALAKEAKYAFWYACFVLERPFPAGEAAIAKDVFRAYNYAMRVLKGRFPAGEAVLAKDAEYAYCYARNILKLPYEEAMNWARTLP